MQKYIALLVDKLGQSTVRPNEKAADMLSPYSARTLQEISNAWSIWRFKSESDRDFYWRLQVHLHTLQIAIEDDIAFVTKLENQQTREGE